MFARSTAQRAHHPLRAAAKGPAAFLVLLPRVFAFSLGPHQRVYALVGQKAAHGLSRLFLVNDKFRQCSVIGPDAGGMVPVFAGNDQCAVIGVLHRHLIAAPAPPVALYFGVLMEGDATPPDPPLGRCVWHGRSVCGGRGWRWLRRGRCLRLDGRPVRGRVFLCRDRLLGQHDDARDAQPDDAYDCRTRDKEQHQHRQRTTHGNPPPQLSAASQEG